MKVARGNHLFNIYPQNPQLTLVDNSVESAAMNTWTPLWSKVVDSSIWMEDKNTRILFVTMLAIKDRDHVVRYSAFELSRKANLTEQEVMDALEVLKQPDTRRLEPQEFEGRRIERVKDGWLMLNGEKYRKAIQELYRREYKRTKQAEYREKENGGGGVAVPPSDDRFHPQSREVLHHLNESSKRLFRETDANLGAISARLGEAGVTIDGVKKMIERQCARWRGTDQEEFLRPETLFGKKKFDGYYAAKDLPSSPPPAKKIDPADRNARNTNSNPHAANQYDKVKFFGVTPPTDAPTHKPPSMI
jgi:uncharacterized phage protein (TIGR02220 family)